MTLYLKHCMYTASTVDPLFLQQSTHSSIVDGYRLIDSSGGWLLTTLDTKCCGEIHPRGPVRNPSRWDTFHLERSILTICEMRWNGVQGPNGVIQCTHIHALCWRCFWTDDNGHIWAQGPSMGCEVHRAISGGTLALGNQCSTGNVLGNIVESPKMGWGFGGPWMGRASGGRRRHISLMLGSGQWKMTTVVLFCEGICRDRKLVTGRE